MGGDIAETVIETGRSWLPDCIIFGIRLQTRSRLRLLLV